MCFRVKRTSRLQGQAIVGRCARDWRRRHKPLACTTTWKHVRTPAGHRGLVHLVDIPGDVAGLDLLVGQVPASAGPPSVPPRTPARVAVSPQHRPRNTTGIGMPHESRNLKQVSFVARCRSPSFSTYYRPTVHGTTSSRSSVVREFVSRQRSGTLVTFRSSLSSCHTPRDADHVC